MQSEASRSKPRKAWKRLGSMAFGTLLALPMLAAVEGVLAGVERFMGGQFFEVAEARPHSFRATWTRNLGWNFAASRVDHRRLAAGGRVVFDVDYEFDTYGRRVDPDANDPATGVRDNYLMFLGGSFTLGHGVRAEESMPAVVQSKMPNSRVYNYGGVGYGPSHLLRLFEIRNLREEISEPHGIAIYTYLDDHLEIVAGSLNALHWSRGLLPMYAWEEDDDALRYVGIFKHVWPRRFAVLDGLNSSRLLRRMADNFPVDLTGDDTLRLAAREIRAIADLYREQFDSEEFYVAFYPHHQRTKQALRRELERHDVRVLELDLPETEFDLASHFLLPDDWHPNRLGHRKMAEALTARLSARAEAPQSAYQN